MSQVNVTINGRQFRMACEDGQEGHLQQLAKDLDERIAALRGQFGEIGDARLTMAKEPNASFDLFIIDAFTSDAIPVHMLTKEAVQLFLDKLKPDGVVLLHTSNRYLDLNSVLGAIQKELPEGTAGVAMQDGGGNDGYGQSGSSVVVFAKSEAALQPYRSIEGALDLDDGSASGGPLRAWTDDYSNLLAVFRWPWAH